MFNFGKNWQDFSTRAANDRSLEAAEQSFQNLLQVDNLSGYSLLDLGCGSGLFSIAAAQLGAAVTAVDVNPLCLKVTEDNIARLAQSDTNIRLLEASALDREKLAALGTFDIVYSWGVLHHTGHMWDAIENVLALVKPEGKLVLSIYNKHFTSPAWRVIKRIYGMMPSLGQRMMALAFGVVIWVAKWLVTRRNPLEKERGMSFWYDVIDWIGGYPYEYATTEEIVRFVSARGFHCLRTIDAAVPTGCNEFVFRKAAS